jgi:hypothetical protein
VSPQDSVKGSSTAVAAITPTDAWLVGDSLQGTRPMSKHWDGKLWRSVPIPLVGTDHSLYGATALATDEVWAVGQYNSGGPLHPLVVRWDGTTWTHIPAPDGTPNSANVFYGIDAISPTDIWAVGYQDTSFLHFQPLIEHWDGTAWEVVSFPEFPGNDNILNDVSAASSDDVWAVGFQGDSHAELRTLAMHWDGAAWTVVETPDVGGTLDVLGGIHGVSPSDAWAVGVYRRGINDATLTEHWDGSTWTIVNSPPTGNGGLDDVKAVAPATVWAIGTAFDAGINDTRPITMRTKGCV